jgi:SEC-C motif-containing protein
MSNCHCGSSFPFKNCCEPYLKNQLKAPTSETLMRSRYTAFAIGAIDYLVATTHLSQLKFQDKSALLEWSKSNHWIKLEVLSSTETTVSFKAYYLDSELKAQIHTEHSTFIFENGSWYYLDGQY